ncbi:MAG: hypothetical protein A2591_02490 [Candidatus Yonathbacteria bacterium RIFOXYD1_FULL_52_36]|uniref:Polysaccharide biosynthesis protein C-terminal domain-containing protein n=1 Tax=Candidatus Yonathbacteria bacterium RIFOXYD1_FULL_52_36 TaxID=1802730 RepID=A0A1G2SLV5_9BACT|nr:MAG: hypothetical protein A2591_02490 [Candidatus Yonathbacteria bacterium RIFOXYD1_FULL_52_36]
MAKSVLRTIGEGTLWTTGSTIILKVVGLATIFLVLHKLSVYEYGLVQLVLSILPILSIFLLPGVGNVVVADMSVARGRGDLGEVRMIFSNYFRLQMVLGFFAWAIVFFGADLIARYYSEQSSILIKIVSFSFLVSPFRGSIQIALRVYLKFFQQSVYTVVEEVLKLGFLVVFFFVLHISVAGVLFATVFAEALTVAVMSFSFFKVYTTFSKAPIQERKPFWSVLYFHTKWGLFTSYLNSFGQNLRLWIVKFMLGTEAAGLFSVASGLLSHTTSLIPISSILAPIIPQYVEQKERFYRLIVKGVKYQLLSSIAVGIAAFSIFPIIIIFLFPNYAESMSLFQKMVFALIPMSFGSLTSAFFALKAQKDLFYATLFRTLLMVVILPPFIFLFGLPGVAYELVLTLSLFVLERIRVLRRLLPGIKMDVRSFFFVDDEDRFLLQRIQHSLKLSRK